jgi:hypothetical protein
MKAIIKSYKNINIYLMVNFQMSSITLSTIFLAEMPIRSMTSKGKPDLGTFLTAS